MTFDCPWPSLLLDGSGVAVFDLIDGAGEEDRLSGPVLFEPGDKGRGSDSPSVKLDG